MKDKHSYLSLVWSWDYTSQCNYNYLSKAHFNKLSLSLVGNLINDNTRKYQIYQENKNRGVTHQRILGTPICERSAKYDHFLQQNQKFSCLPFPPSRFFKQIRICHLPKKSSIEVTISLQKNFKLWLILCIECAFELRNHVKYLFSNPNYSTSNEWIWKIKKKLI